MGTFVTASGRQAVVGGYFVTNLIFCSFVVRVSELEVSWIFLHTEIFSLYCHLFLQLSVYL
jgi:hypothetical protein